VKDYEKTVAVIKWLQECFALLQSGDEDKIPANLFYKSSRGIITDDYVDRMIAKIDSEFEFELEKYPTYHYRNADGATIPPDFHRLSTKSRRALVEGLDRCMGYEA